jgi:hypothetical protein
VRRARRPRHRPSSSPELRSPEARPGSPASPSRPSRPTLQAGGARRRARPAVQRAARGEGAGTSSRPGRRPRVRARAPPRIRDHRQPAGRAEAPSPWRLCRPECRESGRRRETRGTARRAGPPAEAWAVPEPPWCAVPVPRTAQPTGGSPAGRAPGSGTPLAAGPAARRAPGSAVRSARPVGSAEAAAWSRPAAPCAAAGAWARSAGVCVSMRTRTPGQPPPRRPGPGGVGSRARACRADARAAAAPGRRGRPSGSRLPWARAPAPRRPARPGRRAVAGGARPRRSRRREGPLPRCARCPMLAAGARRDNPWNGASAGASRAEIMRMGAGLDA